MKWLLAVLLCAGVAEGQWATPRPTATRRPTAPPAATKTPSPRPTSTPSSQATSTPSPRPTAPSGGSTLNYYLVPLVPIAPFPVGSTLRYADGTEIRMTIQTASGIATAVIVRVDP